MRLQTLDIDELSSRQQWTMIIIAVLGFWILRETFLVFLFGWGIGLITLDHEDEIDGEKITNGEYDWATREIRKVRNYGEFQDKVAEEIRRLGRTESKEE